jgi:hypothetical protein
MMFQCYRRIGEANQLTQSKIYSYRNASTGFNFAARRAG